MNDHNEYQKTSIGRIKINAKQEIKQSLAKISMNKDVTLKRQ
jgi:hypothetical protein